MTMLLIPHLPIVLPTQGITSGPSTPAMELQGINRSGACDSPEEPRDTAKTSATSRRWGGFDLDQEWGLYPLAWDDMADFQAWHWEEELAYTIEILSSFRYYSRPTSLWMMRHVFVCGCEYPRASAKINFSYSILFHLTTSYSSYFGGKKGISRNKTSFFLLMGKAKIYKKMP